MVESETCGDRQHLGHEGHCLRPTEHSPPGTTEQAIPHITPSQYSTLSSSIHTKQQSTVIYIY